MGSNAQNINILNRKQQLLPKTAIQELRAAVKGEVILGGEAPDEMYRAAIDRWNKAWIQEAVRYVPDFCASALGHWLSFRLSSYSARPTKMSLLPCSMFRNGTWG
jgi:hypothetical protein